MDEDRSLSHQSEPETAAQAFERLDGRIAMMARAVGHLAAERASIDIPDYNATLGQMNARLAVVAQELAEIAEKPAMRLTPEGLAERMNAAAQISRAADRATLQEAREGHQDAARIIRSLAGVISGVREQRRHLIWAASGGLVAGCLLWSFLPGVVVRTLPTSWHMPERIAAHIMGAPSLWDAGERLMRADSPLGWEKVAAAVRIRQDNLIVVQACERASRKAQRTVRCTVNVRNRNEI